MVAVAAGYVAAPDELVAVALIAALVLVLSLRLPPRG